MTAARDGYFSATGWLADSAANYGATPEEVRRYLHLFGKTVIQYSIGLVRRAYTLLGEARIEGWLAHGPLDADFIIGVMGGKKAAKYDVAVLDDIIALGTVRTRVEISTVHRLVTRLRQPWAPSAAQVQELLSALREYRTGPHNSPLRVISWLFDGGAARWAELGFALDEYILLVRCGHSPTAPARAWDFLQGYLCRGYSRADAFQSMGLAGLFSGEVARCRT